MTDLAPLRAPEQFLKQVSELGIQFDAGDLERLGLYLALLLDANTRVNLTAVVDRDAVWTRHILDSLTLVGALVSAGARSVIDVGSGGGLPGIPLAIALPDVHFTLAEATGKKSRFLEEVARELSLSNVSVVNDRAETLGQDHQHHREKYDAVIARAVGKLPVLLELTVPLAKVGGLVLAMKGEKAAQDIIDAKAALHALHARVVETMKTPTGVIVIVEKQRKTPRLYPRTPGEPNRAPIGSAKK
ncbi:MAG: 16S rRNA (guanine(527)-N(7))-methyltransferase RsmG [Phycisphaerales bacterium]|nr:16S rRNA (guanine(527)-N(7))-methyltransferase RsmG [Phycisphaerales bacterium]MCI0631474.1 16S rRNA (guanine(527)-N(7))-methyltransferase RsmG [Phycisphaerales bacterium]